MEKLYTLSSAAQHARQACETSADLALVLDVWRKRVPLIVTPEQQTHMRRLFSEASEALRLAEQSVDNVLEEQQGAS